MTSKPVIAVIACTREVEGEPASIVKQRYLAAVAIHAEAVSVIVPAVADAETAVALVARVDALLLTGSNSNIAPERYNGQRAGTPPFDPGRDGTAGHLIRAAIEAGKPVVGICRGLQEVNVAFGGTLADEREVQRRDFSHHAAAGVDLNAMFAYGHNAQAVGNGMLAKIVGDEPISVNSVHFQRIETLGAGLRVEAVAEDGVIEAVSAPGTRAPVLAVQWHPEWRPETRKHDLAFWRFVGQVARGEMS